MDRTETWVVQSRKVLRRSFTSDHEKDNDCSLCFENLEGEVSLCAQGHRLCAKCKLELHDCPICSAGFTGTKNYTAEIERSKIEEIKILLENSDDSDENDIENSMSVGSQTSDMVKKNAKEESPPSPVASAKQLGANEAGLSVEGKGKFPCRIGDCTEEMPYCRMVTHIKYLHEEFLIDVGLVQGNDYTHTWRILYQPNEVFDRALHIYNMGIFFIKIVTNEEGDLFGCVQITNSRVNAKFFQYKLEVGNKNTFVFYEGKVLGSRTASQVSPKHGLTIQNTYLHQLLQKKKSYECILKITLMPNSPLPSTRRNISKASKKLL